MLRRAGFALCLAISFTSPMLADIPLVPEPPPQPVPRPPQVEPNPPAVAPLVILPNSGEDNQTRLRLPALSKREGRIDNAPEKESTRRALASPTRFSTIVAGTALAICFALCGVRFVRGGNRRYPYCGTAVALAVLIVGLTGCPSERRTEPVVGRTIVNTLPRMKQGADGTLTGQALLEQDEKAGQIQLTMERDELAAFLEKNMPAAPER